MSNKQETIEDIVAALRAVAYIQTAESPRDVLEFANRIEAAAKREREAGAEAAQVCGEIGEMIGREAACKDKVKVEDYGEVAKLKRQVKIASDFYLWVVKNAENELLQTIRDKAIEAEFKMNHPEMDGIDFNEEGAK